MRKNGLRKMAATAAAAALSIALLGGCSALGSAPIIASSEKAAESTGDTAAESSSEVSSAAETEAESSSQAEGDGGSRLDDILARGYIEVATEPYFAPYEFNRLSESLSLYSSGF